MCVSMFADIWLQTGTEYSNINNIQYTNRPKTKQINEKEKEEGMKRKEKSSSSQNRSRIDNFTLSLGHERF